MPLRSPSLKCSVTQVFGSPLTVPRYDWIGSTLERLWTIRRIDHELRVRIEHGQHTFQFERGWTVQRNVHVGDSESLLTTLKDLSRGRALQVKGVLEGTELRLIGPFQWWR